MDRAKAAALGGVVALAAVEALYALLRTTPLGGSAWPRSPSRSRSSSPPCFRVGLASSIASRRWPTSRSVHGCSRWPVGPASLRSGVGRRPVAQEPTANAAVVGLGRTRRILLYDTLTASFRPEEIEAVLAHELGHHVHGDMRRGLSCRAC